MKSITERHVQAIWYDASLRPRHLVTSGGTEVSVVSPGEWNLGAGPDFTRAVLEVGKNRRRVVGDVEIHLCPNDWDLHGHGSDPRYRNVIAHVTWSGGTVPASLPPGAFSIWIGRFMSEQTGFSPDQIDLGAYPFATLPMPERPCESQVGHDPDRAQEVLMRAGEQRLLMKARRIAGRLCEARPEGSATVRSVRRQVFYEEVMSALGYMRNSAQFRNVARRVPIADLPEDAGVARMALVVAGGFENWDRGCSRPSNSPERRLACAADVFRLTPIESFADTGDFSKTVCRKMVLEMCGGLRRFMGRGRAAAIIANVIVPFAIAEGRITAPLEWLPPEDISKPVRLMAFRLFGRDHNPRTCYSANGVLIQGLIQVHRELCAKIHPDCDGCTLASHDTGL